MIEILSASMGTLPAHDFMQAAAVCSVWKRCGSPRTRDESCLALQRDARWAACRTQQWLTESKLSSRCRPRG